MWGATRANRADANEPLDMDMFAGKELSEALSVVCA